MHSIELPFANVTMTPGRRQAEVEALGKTIRAERIAAGLTLEQLGARAGGLHRNTVLDYEQGKKEIPFGKLVDIADVLGLTVLKLLQIAEERGEREARRPPREDGS